MGSTTLHAEVLRKLTWNRIWWIWRYGTCIKNTDGGILKYFSFIFLHKTRIFWGKRVRRHMAELLYTRKEVTFCQEYRIRDFWLKVGNSQDSYIVPVPHRPHWLLWEIPSISRFWPHQNRWHLSPRQNSVARAELPSSETIWETYQKVAVVKRGERERFGE